MNELYESKDILINDDFIRSIILDKYEELLSENERLHKELEKLQLRLQTKKRSRKQINSDELAKKPLQLSFETFNEINA